MASTLARARSKTPPAVGLDNSCEQGDSESKNAIIDSSRPEYWDERYAGQRMPWDFGGVPSALRDFLSREKPGKVLVPGCGTGYEVRAFAGSGWQVNAVDFSLEAIRHARKFLGEDVRVVRQADFFADNPNVPLSLSMNAPSCVRFRKPCGDHTPCRSSNPSARAVASLDFSFLARSRNLHRIRFDPANWPPF